MATTDPLADLLVAVRNASVARLDAAHVPDSRFKQTVLKVLQAEGFVKSFRTIGDRPANRKLEIQMAFGPKREALVNGVKRVSRPGRRVYVSLEDLKGMLRRLEVPILSTPQGVLTGAEAFSRKTGGELLCLIW